MRSRGEEEKETVVVVAKPCLPFRLQAGLDAGPSRRHLPRPFTRVAPDGDTLSRETEVSSLIGADHGVD